MGSHMIVYTKYNSGNDFGGGLEVSKLKVKKAGWKSRPNLVYVGFEGGGAIQKAWMYLEPKIAIPLARNLLSVTEGYTSESDLEVS